MRQYLDLLRRILDEGTDKADRTGTGTRSLFGAQSHYDLRQGFPLVTTKKMFFRGMVEELLWMLSGSTNVKDLQARDVHIWDEWALAENGDLGPVYGAQWRQWNGYTRYNSAASGPEGRDQIAELIARIKTVPDDRRLIVTAWNPDEVEAMSLPCCHILFQCWTRELSLGERAAVYNQRLGDGLAPVDPEAMTGHFDDHQIPVRGLKLHLYQRSCDVFLGVPFNIASYALLTHMLAQVTGMIALEFIHTYGDVHIYRNHMDQVAEQLTRTPKDLPRLVLNPAIKDIDAFKAEDVAIEDYIHWPAIKAPVAV